ncbi:MAG: DUF5666 domain-containing protein [Betaproteobacteria bacterium]
MPAPGPSTGATIKGTVVTGLGTSSFSPAASTSITVTVVGTGISTTISSSGSFTLTNVPGGHVQLQFTGSGIQAQLDLGTLADNQTLTITVKVSGTTAEVDDSDNESPDNEAEVEGRVTAIDATAGTMTVGSVDIMVPAGTTIRHGNTPIALADIHVGDRVHVKGTRSGSVVTATEIMVQTSNGNPEPGQGNDHNEVELNGAIAGLGGTCPSLTFTISSTHVTTNASTKFEESACSGLANGTSVEVKGTKQSNGSVLATQVESKGKEN